MEKCRVFGSSSCMKIFICVGNFWLMWRSSMPFGSLITCFLRSGSFQHFSISAVSKSRRVAASAAIKRWRLYHALIATDTATVAPKFESYAVLSLAADHKTLRLRKRKSDFRTSLLNSGCFQHFSISAVSRSRRVSVFTTS